MSPVKTLPMASSSKQFDAIANRSVLTPVMSLEGHEPVIRYLSDGEQYIGHYVSSICYFPDGEHMISGSNDKTARRWDLRAGKEIKEARDVCEAVSMDGRWAVTSAEGELGGKLKAYEVKRGIVRTFESHSRSIHCIDISSDSTLLAGGSYDSTERVWNLDTGKLVAGPFKSDPFIRAVRFSPNSKKLAVKSDTGKCLEVWDVETQTLDVRRVGQSVDEIDVPVFWTTKDKSIIATFNFTDDEYTMATMIYEFDALTLETVGVPFKGHTFVIDGLALSFDCALLASASFDSIKLWAFESRQLLASFDVQIYPHSLIFSPNSHQLAYTCWNDTKIYICDTPPDILAIIWPAQDVKPNTSATKNLDLLNSNATPRRKPVISPVTSFAPRPRRPSPTIYPQQRDFLRYLRKLLPSRTYAALVQNDQPCDPLDFPATSPLPRSSPSMQATTQGRSDMNPHQNARPTPTLPTTEYSATAPTTFTTRLHNLSTWWSVRGAHALPPVVNVPLAQAKERNAAAGAPPKNSEGWIPDEDYVPSRPSSPGPNSQRPPADAVQINAGEHGSGRLCGCF